MPITVSGTKLVRAREALAFFTNVGWSREHAAGLIANIEAESEFDPQALGAGGLAFGICQWHPGRQAAFKAEFGSCIRESSYVGQLRFVDFELHHAEHRAGETLREVLSARNAGEVVCRLYERPIDPNGNESFRRGTRAQDWLNLLA
ncbi:MAG: phage tail tip lysozyme [Reyranella sp.]|uniref:phage tail tip lysozyme n=1 Tax=Reyranella sp. TaxID=1929291 RepID=UPI003D0C0235